jgi:hypothetical protein
MHCGSLPNHNFALLPLILVAPRLAQREVGDAQEAMGVIRKDCWENGHMDSARGERRRKGEANLASAPWYDAWRARCGGGKGHGNGVSGASWFMV